MNLKIEQETKPELSEIEFKETLNVKNIKKLMSMDIIEDDEQKNKLIKINKKLDENGNRRCKYEYRTIKYGRLYEKNNLGSLDLSRKIRGVLYENYYDIDIVNCQPTILYEICKKEGIICNKLKKYIEERDKIIEQYKINKNEIKKLFIVIMFGGKYNDSNYDDELKIFLKEFQNEIKMITMIILGHNKKMYEKIEKIKKEKENMDGTIFAYFLQEKERQILEIMVKYIIKNYVKDKNISLCSDGLMIKKENYNEKMEEELEKEIMNKTGYCLKIKKKEMEDEYLKLIKKDDELMKNYVFEEKYIKIINIEYMKTLKTYDLKKKYFELFVCKIFSPNAIFIFKNNENINFYKKMDLINTFEHIKYKEYEDGKIIDEIFIKKWLKDNNMLCYNQTDFIPLNCAKPENNNIELFNLFQGYNEKINSKYNKEDEVKILKPFEDLGLQLCEGNEKYYDYLLHYMANIIQNPTKKIGKCIILLGAQGTGKGVFLSGFSNVINKQHYYETEKPDEIFGKHSELFLNKLVVTLNESEYSKTKDYEGDIKTFITELKRTVNCKFLRPIEINNFASLFVCSNKSIPIKIDAKSKDRRFVIFKTTDEYSNAKKYNKFFWEKMCNHFKKPEFIAALYNKLNSLNVNTFNFKNSPITTAYKTAYDLSLPSEIIFMKQYVEKIGKDCMKTFKIKSIELYNNYMEWLTENGHMNEKISTHLFYSKMNEFNPIECKLDNGYKTYKFKSANLYNFMSSKGWTGYDELMKYENTLIEENNEFDDYFDI
jgi:hypothetical protein